MRYNNDAELVLGPIAEVFLMQLQAFGLAFMGNFRRLNATEDLAEVLARFQPRLSFIKAYFQFLEITCDFRCDDTDVILYNTADWPADSAPDGRRDTEVVVRPSQLVTSYGGAWNLHQRDPLSMVDRVIKAALWECQERSLLSAVQYVLRLEKHGYILHPLVTVRVLMTLLAARARGREETLVRRMLSSARSLPTDLQAFVACELRYFPPVKHVSTTRAQNEIAAIIRHALEATEDARNAASYAEWWLTQRYLHPHLYAVLNLFRHIRNKPGLALSTVLYQLEEIRCDAGAAVRNLSALRPTFYGPEAVLLIYEQNGGDDWVERAVRERAIVPRAILPWLLRETREPLPDAWAYMDPTIAYVLNDVILGTPCRLQPQLEASLGNDHMGEIRRWIENVLVPAQYNVGVREVASILTQYPWHPALWQEMAIAQDMKENNREAALASMAISLLLNPESASGWDSLSVILHKLGKNRESDHANRISQWLQAETSPSAEVQLPSTPDSGSGPIEPASSNGS
jgi:hypothetical protein